MEHTPQPTSKIWATRNNNKVSILVLLDCAFHQLFSPQYRIQVSIAKTLAVLIT